MTRSRTWLLLALVAAQTATSVGAARAQSDSLAVPAPIPHRASWLSDSVALRTGDVVTVVIDERTTARERAFVQGTDKRSVRADFSSGSGSGTNLSSGWAADSREGGEANRQGDLYGMVTARVVSVDPSGLAHIEGSKKVTIDGREQEITLTGMVRPEDLSSQNAIRSSRVADATITYKGKKMTAKKGIFGKILSILWPL